MDEMNFGHSVPISMTIQREERINHEKTQQLMRQLKEIERKSIQMRKETERLRLLKDEAKQKVKDNFPHIFKRQLFEGGNEQDSIRFTEDELEISDTSISSGDMTRSEGDETSFHLGRNRFGQLPRNLNHMSKEVQEVYTKMVASNNFDKNLSDSSDLEGSKKLSKRINNLKQHKLAWTQQNPYLSNQQFLQNDALGNMLKNFDQQHITNEEANQGPFVSDQKLENSSVRYSFIQYMAIFQ